MDLYYLRMYDPMIYFTCGVVGSFGILFLMKKLEKYNVKMRLLNYLGKNSLIIFLTHMIVIYYVKFGIEKLFGSIYVNNELLSVLAILASVLCIEFIIVFLFNKILPVLMGGKEGEYMKEQFFYDNYLKIEDILKQEQPKKLFIVCSKFILNSEIMEYIRKLQVDFVTFTDFTPNPKYEEVVAGVEQFKKEACDFIVSIGGGSGIDVAKCINLFLDLDETKNYLQQELKPCKIKHLSIPTTAGTGSESTRFAVIYKDGIKQSITHTSIIPEYVILDASFLNSLPVYQKKATLMDSLCHAIESYWSVNSTEESQNYSKESIQIILDNMDTYLNHPNDEVNKKIMLASNLSGKAINITQTTAAHAMSYKMTSFYQIAHGHAVALCLGPLWNYMIHNFDKTVDQRGIDYVKNVFVKIADIFGANSLEESVEMFKKMISSLNLDVPELKDEEQLELLTTSVNPTRLKNNPIFLDEEAIRSIYLEILDSKECYCEKMQSNVKKNIKKNSTR